MVKLAERAILIQEFDGSRTVFDPVGLQTRLINCFLAAGLRESSYMAEDIALAVEYTLLNSPRPDSVFGRGELGAAVVRMLEETGFPDVAALFRRNGGETTVTIDAEPGPVTDLLHKFLACPPERFQRVVDQVCNATRQLNIRSASPHLLLELARYYERLAESEQPPAEVMEAAAAHTVSQSEITALLPPEVRELVDAGVIRVNGISTLFPCIRFFFIMNRFAEKFALTAPVTELEIGPLLYRMSAMLEKARAAIEASLKTPEPLPLYLALPDMLDFIVVYLGGERSRSEKLGRELARALAAEFTRDVYKLSIS